jgi:hypothetical protein
MKKTINLMILVWVSLALLFAGASAAKEDQKKRKGSQSFTKQAQLACKSLKYTRMDQDTILITKGFSCQKNREVKIPILMGIMGVKEGNAFVLDEASPVPDPEFESAVNITWEFLKPDIVFRRDGCVYTSTAEGATIKFTKEGVLVKNFKISGIPKKKMKHKIK